MKKLLALVLAAAMLLGITSALAEETPTLTLWCIATESDSNRVAYEKAIPEIEEALGVKIEWEAFENDSYKTKIKSTSAEELPDIFFTWAGAFCGDFATAGKVYCLDEAYAEYADALPDVMTKNATYDGKRYAVPLTMNIVAMFANMDLLAQVGYEEVPTTYEELIDVFNYSLDNKAWGVLTSMTGIDCYFMIDPTDDGSSGEKYLRRIISAIVKDGEVIWKDGRWAEGWKDRKVRIVTSEFSATTNRNKGGMDNPLCGYNGTDRLVSNDTVLREAVIKALKDEAAENDGHLNVDTDTHFIFREYEGI